MYFIKVLLIFRDLLTVLDRPTCFGTLRYARVADQPLTCPAENMHTTTKLTSWHELTGPQIVKKLLNSYANWTLII